MVEQALAHGEHLALLARHGDERAGHRLRVIVGHRVPVCAHQCEEPVPEGGLPESPREPFAFLGLRGQVVEEPLVLQATHELELTELRRLEPARRCQHGTELQEILRGHRLQHLDVLDQHPLDRVHAHEQVPRALRSIGEHRVASGFQLEEQLLEPELVGLVHDDEHQLVVHRRVRPELLQRQQLGDLQVRPVRQQPLLRLVSEAPEPSFLPLALVIRAR